jgi:hypothetical protein
VFEREKCCWAQNNGLVVGEMGDQVRLKVLGKLN